jgi:uncharacterized protein (TIGR01244 family)
MRGPFPYDGKFRIAGSLTAADIPLLKQIGITLVVNTAPPHAPGDGLTAQELRPLLAGAGIMFADIAFSEEDLTSGHVDTFLTVATPARKVLVACGDGQHSAVLLAAAELRRGVPMAEIARKVAAMSYDVSHTVNVLFGLRPQAA